ncbi:hypothetical protein R8871_03845 [Paraburkholderia graminis C4D1M]|uniref:YetF C-terminal domain-containing protein n=1 Tax=Paraburkholderia graminis (strain ATCC 700544 / DSM 17151 / LMG 18924 / NCIMB 13744 / C4D1M) TaxID=396598 RepID=B1G2Z3_PARG4|nr:YetF domain-containing protein [Paraburkholderia graminis]EDT09388.1 protein of unknown function DUF421 [Paraburkholderia graminis C4D1M]CAB3706025.1 hypothetical protein R8871_03845 [Paraburkholderia graminis C4D1M]
MQLVQRILIGDGPWAFLLEVVVRAALVYVLLLVAMRMMGKRVAAQLSITELAVILMLGAAIGVPIQVSSQGILPAAIVLFTVVALQRMSSRAGLRWRKFQVAQEGDVTMLVKDGRILLDELKTSEVSREMLASELRAANVAHLGQLRRVYLESSGSNSLVWRKHERPGLTVRPDMECSLLDAIGADGYFACWSCGATVDTENRPTEPCSACRSMRWESAVQLPQKPKVEEKTE